MKEARRAARSGAAYLIVDVVSLPLLLGVEDSKQVEAEQPHGDQGCAPLGNDSAVRDAKDMLASRPVALRASRGLALS